MRLLDTSTLKFTKDVYRPPPYAILSHTWGEEEVTFQEYGTPLASGKSGQTKIEAACRIARSYGCFYVWIDTCCIDKSSSAELSEAINSMYHWYKHSSICLIFLEDVVTERNPPWILPEDGHLEPGQAKRLEASSLAKSRWFTRGWTLQELIAPNRRIFFDKEWERMGELGENDDMLAAITCITKVDSSVLSPKKNPSRGLDQMCVARRMSWAAERKTTRVEDQAYCLMGLFDVNMPLLYGEGEKAFLRLQEEILKTTQDDSILAWSGNRPDWQSHHLRGVLADSPTCFKKCGKLINPASHTTAPWTVSNLGLQLSLPLIPADHVEKFSWNAHPGVFYLLLECRDEHDPDSILARSFQACSTDPSASILELEARTSARMIISKRRLVGQRLWPLATSPLILTHKLKRNPLPTTVLLLISPKVLDHGGNGLSIKEFYPSESWDRGTTTFVDKAVDSESRPAAVRFTSGVDDLYMIFQPDGGDKYKADGNLVLDIRLLCLPRNLFSMRDVMEKASSLMEQSTYAYHGPLSFRTVESDTYDAVIEAHYDPNWAQGLPTVDEAE